jgi:phage gp36-like protein
MYCTKQDLLDRGWEKELIQLTDKATPRAGVIDEVALQQAIDDATDTINSYIAKYLPLPVDYVGMVRIGCDIARYMLYDNKATEQVTARYEQAIRYLEKVANGSVSLMQAITAAPISQPVMIEMTASPRLFGR